MDARYFNYIEYLSSAIFTCYRTTYTYLTMIAGNYPHPTLDRCEEDNAKYANWISSHSRQLQNRDIDVINITRRSHAMLTALTYDTFDGRYFIARGIFTLKL